MSERIYLDFNATTPLCQSAIIEMSAAAQQLWGNPSSAHAEGQSARAAVEKARADVAELVGASEREIVFNSGATESINWAHHQVPNKGGILTTAVEHVAVMSVTEEVVRSGRASLWIGARVDSQGRLDPKEISIQLERRGEIELVSVMLANNEIGVCYPVKEIAETCREFGVICHTDASQVVGRLPVSFTDLGVDLASFSAHKLYGPKGVGALFIRQGFLKEPFVSGGHQERGRRAGTENLLGIIGFGAAARAAVDLQVEAKRQQQLCQQLLQGLSSQLDGIVVNGDLSNAIPNTLNISFLGCDAESLLIALDLEGVSVSAGSACSSGSLEPSHVLLAICRDEKRHKSAIRFSVGRPTTEDEIGEAIERVVRCVLRLRQ